MAAALTVIPSLRINGIKGTQDVEAVVRLLYHIASEYGVVEYFRATEYKDQNYELPHSVVVFLKMLNISLHQQLIGEISGQFYQLRRTEGPLIKLMINPVDQSINYGDQRRVAEQGRTQF